MIQDEMKRECDKKSTSSKVVLRDQEEKRGALKRGECTLDKRALVRQGQVVPFALDMSAQVS